MANRLLICAAALILCACFITPKSERDKPRAIQVQHPVGCRLGMRLTALDTMAQSVCLPFGSQWKQVRSEIDGLKDFSICVFSPVNSSPMMHASYIDKGGEGRSNNLILEPHFTPESDAVIAISISNEDPPHPFPWSEMRESHVDGMNYWRYGITDADPDTLKTMDRVFREIALQNRDPSLTGKAWAITTRNGVDWAYELWVRRIQHTGQVRAGITAFIQDEDKSAFISAHWLRKNLSKELDEVRSDTLFVIFNEVVESFKWAE